MKNLSEALKEFRNRFLWTVHPTEIAVPGTKSTTYWNKDVEPEESLIFLKSTLISLLDEVVMDEKRLIHDVNWAEGYNACRATLIKKINEIKK